MGDKRHYDFVIEKDNYLQSVQVKYAGLYKRKGQCLVGLRITGDNQSYNYAKKYADDAFDILFVYTQSGEKYAIPWHSVNCRNQLMVGHPRYRKYRISAPVA